MRKIIKIMNYVLYDTKNFHVLMVFRFLETVVRTSVFQRVIQNQVEHLIWGFVRKLLTAFRELFL